MRFCCFGDTGAEFKELANGLVSSTELPRSLHNLQPFGRRSLQCKSPHPQSSRASFIQLQCSNILSRDCGEVSIVKRQLFEICSLTVLHILNNKKFYLYSGKQVNHLYHFTYLEEANHHNSSLESVLYSSLGADSDTCKQPRQYFFLRRY